MILQYWWNDCGKSDPGALKNVAGYSKQKLWSYR